MEENEDLHENIFFIALKGKYKNTYLQAEKNCYFICIPSNKCLLNNQDITQDDIDTHILVPSPFIMGEYITLNGKTLEIDNSNVITKKGFDQNRTAKILFEELFYNKDYKKFTVVCIDKPLQGKLNQKKTQETDELNLPPPNKRTFNECEKFLYSFPENELVLKKIEEYIKSFCKNYFIVKGFEHHSKKKAEELIERASDDLLCVNVIFRKAYNLNKNFDDLQLVIENFVMGKLSEKVYGTIGDIYTKEDDETFKAINSSQSLQKTDVGVTEAFLDLNLENPIKLFQTMQNAITPLDKLFILKETIQAINNEASNLNISVGSDDLLPLLVYIVLQSNSKKIHSSFLYMENFLFFDFDTNEIGFNLISFKAACSYIQNDPVIKKLKEKKYPPVEQKSNNVQVFSMNMFSSSDSKLKPQRTSNRRCYIWV
eukprot:TRINITY_DN6956_c0_g1_i1.p1 TRINITY_DN6956_c0_g1~~TRINITY_DN6956_c0_g1_i1.p1  ORF type:complete len:438 (-),score=106.31 TRINITY_DN6956_c0_g1_i1:568-1851(-)